MSSALATVLGAAAPAVDVDSTLDATTDTTTVVVFVLVVAARFALPLLIFKYPLPAIIGCLLLDGYDQTIFQWFGADPPGYQSYDKAMDVFYLMIAYLSTLRNWRSESAFRIGWFLFVYRMVGVVLFEATHARWVLMVFPNTFEYFFIAYEAIRTRWNPVMRSRVFWLATAAAIWVVVKLPQEYWLHVAQMDMSDTLRDHPWMWGVLAGLALVAAGVVAFVCRRFLGRPDHDWQFTAPAIPPVMDTADARARWIAQFDAIRSFGTLEKVVLVGLLSVIYAQVLPGYTGSNTWLFIGVAVVVVANAFFSIAMAQRRWTVQGAARSIFVRLAFNLLLVIAADWFLGSRSGDLFTVDTFFFMSLIALLVTLHDRYRPVHGTVMWEAQGAAGLVDGETAARTAPGPR